MDYHGHSSGTLTDNPGQRPLSDVLGDIGTNIQEIIRSEIKLAKIEATEIIRRLQQSSVALAGGAVFGIFAIGFSLLAIMFALEMVLAPWLAAVLVAVLALCGAGIGLSAGRQRLKSVRRPELTIQTVKEDLEWMKEQAKS
jgi:hypothetical protein